MAKVMMSEDPGSQARMLTIYIDKQFDVASEASAIRRGIKDACKAVADKWVEENHDKVMARLNVDAIANMIMLEVANDIKQDARKDKK